MVLKTVCRIDFPRTTLGLYPNEWQEGQAGLWTKVAHMPNRPLRRVRATCRSADTAGVMASAGGVAVARGWLWRRSWGWGGCEHIFSPLSWNANVEESLCMNFEQMRWVGCCLTKHHKRVWGSETGWVPGAFVGALMTGGWRSGWLGKALDSWRIGGLVKTKLSLAWSCLISRLQSDFR